MINLLYPFPSNYESANYMEQSHFSEADINPAIPHFSRPRWWGTVFRHHFNQIHTSCPSTSFIYSIYCGM